MDKKLLDLPTLVKTIRNYELGKHNRTVKLQTGAGGHDLFCITMEETMGLKRIFSSKQLPRIFKIKLNKNYKGKYYRLVKM